MLLKLNCISLTYCYNLLIVISRETTEKIDFKIHSKRNNKENKMVLRKNIYIFHTEDSSNGGKEEQTNKKGHKTFST